MREKNIEVLKQQICYIDENVKEEKTLLFLHGWGQSKESFFPIVSNLISCKVRIVSMDLPGFGKSEEPKSIFGVEDYANIINEFINKLALKNVIIVGHSFGCRCSFYIASENDKIKKMLLTGAAGIKPKRTIRYHISVLGYKFQKLLCKTPFYFQYKEDLLVNSGSSDYKMASSKMKQVLIKVVNEDLQHLFPKIKQEVILFWGIQDEQTPIDDGILMNEKLANSKLIQVEGSHYAFLENQDAFLREIKKLF